MTLLMNTIKTAHRQILAHPEPERTVFFLDFVDDFRRDQSPAMIAEPFPLQDERIDALCACAVETLCDELGLSIPQWILDVPPCKTPYFVGGYQNLRALALVESPLRFRMRLIFVLENFLTRV